MLTDVSVSLGHAADLVRTDGPLADGPILVIPRRIVGGVAAALDGLPPAVLPRLRFEGRAGDLRPKLRRAVAERLPRPRWLANWLVDDVSEFAGLMVSLTGASALRVTLDVDHGDDRRAFGLADVRLRLVTTYRGPSIEWVSPRAGRAPWNPELLRPSRAAPSRAGRARRAARWPGCLAGETRGPASGAAGRADGPDQAVSHDRRGRADASLIAGDGERWGARRPSRQARATSPRRPATL